MSRWARPAESPHRKRAVPGESVPCPAHGSHTGTGPARAPAGPDSRAPAIVLLELNERSLEQCGDDEPLAGEQRIEAPVSIWLRAVYGIID